MAIETQARENATGIYEEERLREAARLDEREQREDIEEKKEEIKNMIKAIRASILIVCAIAVAYFIFFS